MIKLILIGFYHTLLTSTLICFTVKLRVASIDELKRRECDLYLLVNTNEENAMKPVVILYQPLPEKLQQSLTRSLSIVPILKPPSLMLKDC